jgi:hypothetical protein
LRFDGSSDYVAIADNNALDLVTNGTVVVIFKATSVATEWQSIISKRATGTNYEVGISTSSRLFVYNGSAVGYFTFTPTNDVWTHCAVVWSGATASLYINGVFKESTSSALGAVNAHSLGIGALPSGSQGFLGEIKDVRIHNRALEDTEVAAAYNGESTPFKYADSAGDVVPTTSNSNAADWTENPDADLVFDSDHMEVSNTTANHGVYLTPANMGITATAGRRYRISAKIKSGSASAVPVTLQAWPLSSNVEAGNAFVSHTATSEFVLVSTEFTMGATAFSQIGVWPSSDLAGANIEFKDFKFEEVGEVAAYTPQSIEDSGQWYDTTSNANHGTISGATSVNNPLNYGQFRAVGKSASANLLKLSNRNKGLDDYTRIVWEVEDGETNSTTLYEPAAIQFKTTDKDAPKGRLEFAVADTGSYSAANDRNLVLDNDGSVTATSAASDNLKQVARVHSEDIEGTGSRTRFTITHNLGTEYVNVSVFQKDNAAGGGNRTQVECLVHVGEYYSQGSSSWDNSTSNNHCEIEFATAPTNGVEYGITVTG